MKGTGFQERKEQGTRHSNRHGINDEETSLVRYRVTYGGNESVIRTRVRCLQTGGHRGVERAHANCNEAEVKRRDKGTSVSREQTKIRSLDSRAVRRAVLQIPEVVKSREVADHHKPAHTIKHVSTG